MNDELTIKDGKTYINCFYADECSYYMQLSELKAVLQRLCETCSWFIEDQFDLSKFNIIINLNLVTDLEIQEINHKHRQKNKATDVLSFPLQENIRGGDFDDFTLDLELGDMFICNDICKNQAVANDIRFKDEFVHLFIHGFLHLCGYDHELSSNEEKLMQGLEAKMVSKFISIAK